MDSGVIYLLHSSFISDILYMKIMFSIELDKLIWLEKARFVYSMKTYDIALNKKNAKL